MDAGFYKAEDSLTFSFFRIPKALITNPKYKDLSYGAKFLYGLIFERMGLSVKNRWYDEDGNVFVYYTVDEVMQSMCCANKKAIAFLRELEKYDLILRKRQGLGKPSRIYIKRFEVHFLKCENDTSGDAETTLQEVSESHGNKTDMSKTDKNKTNLPTIREAERLIRENIEYDTITGNPYLNRDVLDCLITIMAECIASRKESFHINGEDIPQNAVAERFLSLNNMHLEYVIDALRDASDIRSIRPYIISVLYNSVNLIDVYYTQKVKRNE
ncbi:MAG: replication initiator protein A [Eubacteriaceae bacterium]|nr:replication initiator protein A [Eubacteriaceae bacterium]